MDYKKPSLDEIFGNATEPMSPQVQEKPSLNEIFSGNIDAQSQQISPFEIARDVGIGATALGGAGYGAYQYFKPAFEARKIGKEIRDIQKQEGITGTELKYVPKYYQQKLQLEKLRKVDELSTLRLNTKASYNLMDKNLESLDSVMISPKIEESATVMKTAFPKFLKSATDAYDAGLEGIDKFLEGRKLIFPKKDYMQGVIDKTIQNATEAGILPENLKDLYELKNVVSPKSTKPLTFSQAKSYISQTINKDPYGASSGMLRNSWNEFLETNPNIPVEARGELSLLNKTYKPVIEARNALRRVVKTEKGEYNQQDLYKYFWKYIKARETADAESLMRLVGEGNKLTEPQINVASNFKSLQKLKQERLQLLKKYPELKQTSFAQGQSISEKAAKNISRLTILRNKAQELESKHSAALSKMWGRIPTSILGRLFLKGAMPTMGVASQLFQAAGYAQDPEAFFYEQLTGQPLPPKGTMERDIQTGRLL